MHGTGAAQQIVHTVEGVQPGEVYKYSDLSMITLAYVVGHLSRDLGLVAEKDLHVLCADTLRNEPRMCYFEAYVRLCRRVGIEPAPADAVNTYSYRGSKEHGCARAWQARVAFFERPQTRSWLFAPNAVTQFQLNPDLESEAEWKDNR